MLLLFIIIDPLLILLYTELVVRLINLGDRSSNVSFAEALSRGIAPDGSLYFPTSIPVLTPEELDSIKNLNHPQIAELIIRKWLGDEIPEAELHRIVERASNFPVPVIKTGKKYVLELFHGPTMAFKDVAARYLAELMSYFNPKGSISTVLVATSGDTGGAIAHGFGGMKDVRVVVLFPKGRVSELQYEQLTRVDKNVTSIEVDGTFDDCQSLVKQAFANEELSKYLNLTSANSISIGRLLPQITYYASAWGQLKRDDLRFVVPTGNLGDLTAGLFAWSMGVPIKSFVAANNQNDALARYLETGEYEPRDTISTLSNAMDVGAPNNLPRFVEIFDGNVSNARKMVKATMITDKETVDTIKSVYKKYDYLLDPHTAVGWAASERLTGENTVDVIVSTASPVKFSKEIEDSTGIKVSNEKELAKLRVNPQSIRNIKAEFEEFKKELMKL